MDIMHLPNDVSTLKKIIHSQAVSYNTIQQNYTAMQQDYIHMQQGYTTIQHNYTDLERRHSILREGYDLLEEQMRVLKSAIYGRKSEQYSKEEGIQACLFNEAEAALETFPESNKTEEIIIAAHKRAKAGRRALPSFEI